MMVAAGKAVKRTYIGSDFQEVCELPNLIGIQLESYERFLQRERCEKGEAPDPSIGLEKVFRNSFPIELPNGGMRLVYKGYTIDFDHPKASESECKKKGRTYSVPLKATISLEFKDGEMREKEIFFGDLPLMTDRGTFIINGAERVVVSQIHRSPGVVFSVEKGVYSSKIVPYRGSWLEFEIDGKKNLIYTKIDRRKKILGTLFLRAIGFDTREKIIAQFYKTKKATLENTDECKKALDAAYLAKDVYAMVEGSERKVVRAGDQLNGSLIDQLISLGVKDIELVDMDEETEGTLHSDMILNCFPEEDSKYTTKGQDEPSKADYLTPIYDVLLPGEPVAIERAEKDLPDMFFSEKKYNLGDVGRYKFNKKFGCNTDMKVTTLLPEDIINTMRWLIRVFIREKKVDDIDHLGNRRVRSVGELLEVSLSGAFSRMTKIATERMNLMAADDSARDSAKPQDFISIKPVVAAVKEFFGSSQLSQFMDQVNPLSELTHKRRLTALGPGGLSRDRAGFEVRDVHYTHYGRICPIETPEGPNIGLIVSLANYTRVNKYGFLETPYRKVVDGVATKEVEYLDADVEENYVLAMANAKLDKDGRFLEKEVPCRHGGDYTTRPAKQVSYMDVSPKQVISVAASLITFLEHDDANRALMGCNMQRQAVPLLFPEAPRVGTGMEGKAAYDSGVLVKAKRPGTVTYVSSDTIVVKPDAKNIEEAIPDVYKLLKYQRTNQDTCFNQKPIVEVGQHVVAGEPIADGPATQNGELALGRNILVGFVPWNGYNYEDAVLISERVVKEDIFTTIHIKEYSIDIRDTKLGAEKLTREIPNVSEKLLSSLDKDGIVRVGTIVHPGSILVGKVTPKSESDTTPEARLLNSIFGEKAQEVRDTSLKVPHGTEGTVIDIQRLTHEDNDELPAGVEETVKVLIATKRKLQAGDKMAGRHGNKGVVSRVLPEEDMPFMADGRPLDVCLNPLGVPSRMNIGQLMETQLGWAGVTLDQWYSSPVFQSASLAQIQAKAKEAGLPIDSKVTLYDGRTGVPFVNKVFCGYIYYLKLDHLVDDKMHARSTGPYSLVTQQPLGGKAQFGGQRLGEMEVWALEAYGAANTLQEMLTIKSDDMNGRVKIYESIVKGEPASGVGVPEAFNVLVQEIRGLALDMSVWAKGPDGREHQVALTERDEKLIKDREMKAQNK